MAYTEVRRGVCGLIHDGTVAYKDLVEYLVSQGFYPSKYTPRLWFDKKSKPNFTLIVNDFGVKYCNQQSSEILINVLSKKHDISTDWTGGAYCSVTLE